MDEKTCTQFLEDYFTGNFEVLDFMRVDESSNHFEYHCNCYIHNEEEVNRFLEFYMQETNETVKLKVKKKNKNRSIYKLKVIYRCHHDTRRDRRN